MTLEKLVERAMVEDMHTPAFSGRALFSVCWAVFLVGFFLVPRVEAQERPSFWKAELPGGSYLVSHAAIASISLSRYVVDGVVRVTEVTVATAGSTQGRFYFMEESVPSSPVVMGQSALEDLKARAREILERVDGINVDGEVVKNYPTTTHAHTVEFRLASLEDLEKLHQHLENSFTNRRTATFRP
jgi:hypothetical protein